jgi:hypothetical protein
MELMSEDWEIVSRKTNYHWIQIVLTFLFDDFAFSDVTWTVRQKSTGNMKRVTAFSESEAADLIAKGYFDAD